MNCSSASSAAFAAPSLAIGAARPRVVVIGGGAGGATAARYIAKDSKDYYLAISYYNKVIKIDSNFEAYTNRGISKSEIGDKKGACEDYKKAINLGTVSTKEWLATSGGKWCREM